MNIAYILPSLANKGPVLVTRDLVQVMVVAGHICEVFYFDDITEVEFSCPVRRISFVKRYDFARFTVVHSHGLRPDMYVWLHRRQIPCRCVTTLHSFIFEDLAAQYNRFTAFIAGRLWLCLLRRHDRIVLLNHTAKSYYERWIPSVKLSVVYNTRTIDTSIRLTLDEERELLEFKGKHLFLGVNALLTPIKGIDLLLKSMPFIDEARLWVVGNGKSMTELQWLAKELGVEERVRFVGYHPAAYRYIPYYDIYAMPSRSEGFPLALLEVAIFGCPSVCSDIPVFKEIFTDKEVSFFHLENIPSLVEAIRHAAKEGTSMGERMHLRYKTCYSPEQFRQGYLSVYE